MKKLFILLNFMMCICVALLTVLHFSYKERHSDPALNDTPQEPTINVKPTFKFSGSPLSETRVAYVSDHDLFNPTRGIDPNSLKKTVTEKTIKQNQLEIMGLFKFGDMKGAIISSVASKSKSNLEKKQFYKIGEKIAGTSYILQDVRPEDEMAIVSLGATQYILKLEQDDKASLSRRKSAVAASNERIKATNSNLNLQNKKRNYKNIKNPIIRNRRNNSNVKRIPNSPKTRRKQTPMKISGRQRFNMKRR
jgi:hypothetical protein